MNKRCSKCGKRIWFWQNRWSILNEKPHSKSHDQRKGQWLYNKIREPELCNNFTSSQIGDVIFEMSNEEFDEIMEKYYDSKTKDSGGKS